jgi:hypothetical protein
MKGCRNMSLRDILSSGFFFMIRRMKSLASFVTSTYSGKVISSSTWVIAVLRCGWGRVRCKFGREFCQVSTSRSSCRLPKRQLSHRRPSITRFQANNKAATLRPFDEDCYQRRLPNQNRLS